MPWHDGVENKKVIAETVALLAANSGSVQQGTVEIDTQGADKFSVAMTLSRAIGADDVRFLPYESDTSGGTFTAIDTAKLLPTFAAADNHKLPDPVSGQALVYGAFSTKRYVKLAFDLQTLGTNLTIEARSILEMESRPTDINPAKTGDGLP